MVNVFHVLFEAGYLHKYKDIVWVQACQDFEDDEDEEEEDDSSSGSVAVVCVRKPAKSSRRLASDEEISLSGNFEKNQQRKSSFKLGVERHDRQRSPRSN
jgi:hypothetical protein